MPKTSHTEVVPGHKTSTMDVSNSTALRGKSWRAPITIFLSLAGGIGLAAAHHSMGSYLDGQPVADIWLSQAWISRLSTAFAFLVKMMLTISVGTAYVQRQWMQIHLETLRVEDVDTLTTVLGNVFGICRSTMWNHHPMLTVLALVSWSVKLSRHRRMAYIRLILTVYRGLPFATITAPGSLTVSPVSLTITNHSRQVPQPDYNETLFGNIPIGPGFATEPRIYALAYRAASAAQPVPMTPLYPNASFTLDFYGPAVRCAPSTDAASIRNISITFSPTLGSGGGIAFASWVGATNNSQWTRSDGYEDESTLDLNSPDASRITIVTNTGNWSRGYEYDHQLTGKQYALQANVTECDLYNASYSVNSTFRYPNQSHDIGIVEWLNKISSKSTLTHKDTIPYLAVMDAFGKILVGTSEYNSRYGSKTDYLTSMSMIQLDWEYGEQVRHGLEQLFQNITLSLLSDNILT